MHIKQKNHLYDLELILNWEDFETLNRGDSIVTRYDGEHKIYIHRIYPCDSNDYESRMKSFR